MVAKERHFFANPHYSPPRFRLPPKRSLARAGLGIVRQTGSCLFHVRVFSTLKGHLRRLYTSNRVVNHPLRWPAVRACCVTWCCVESLSAYELRSLSLSLCLDPLSDKQPLRPCPSICLAKRCFLAAHQGGPSAHVAESTAITASLLALLGGWDGRYLRQTGATVVVFSLSGNHTRGASPRVEVCDVSIIMFFGSINELEGDVGCVEGVSDDAPPGMAALWT